MKIWYNGYSWNGREKVYNPNSILNFFKKRRIDNYWFSSATPTFLINALKSDSEIILKNREVESGLLDNADPIEINNTQLLFQTGYLTVKSVKNEDRVKYTLGIPNREVEESLFERLLSLVSEKSLVEIQKIRGNILKAITNEDAEGLRDLITIYLLSEIPYQLHVKKEHYYHSIFLIWLKTLGFKILNEDSTNIGSIDSVLIKDKETVVIEIKYSETEKQKDLKKGVEKAFKSINEKKYFEKYLKHKNSKLLAIAFNRKDNLCEFRKNT
ncbi:PD-(D/E)XK nuclease domain-containing protein [Methanobrevibacter curvatus]